MNLCVRIMSRFTMLLAVVSLLSFTGLSCRQEGAPAAAKLSSGDTNPQIFQVNGVYKEFFPDKKKYKNPNQDIPN